jgi:hypothetical protein
LRKEPQEAANFVNDLADQDTFGKIPEIVKADDLKTTPDSAPAFVFRHGSKQVNRCGI